MDNTRKFLEQLSSLLRDNDAMILAVDDSLSIVIGKDCIEIGVGGDCAYDYRDINRTIGRLQS